MSDKQFTEYLQNYLQGAGVPLFHHPDGTINRAKTLRLTVFDGLNVAQKELLLA